MIAPLRRFEVEATAAVRLDEVVPRGYLEGLHDAGWHGEPWMVRSGYSAAISLRLPFIVLVLRALVEESQRVRVEQTWGRPIEQVMEQWAPATYFVLDRADEARALLPLL